MLNYLVALGSMLVGLVCLFLSRSRKYFGNMEGKYGEAAAQKVTRIFRNWSYFFLIAGAVLIVALSLEGLR
jgi:hypothetical protein